MGKIEINTDLSKDQTIETQEDIENSECKICYKRFDSNEVNNGLVINPCNCQGVFAFAHNTCINQRLELNGHESCDICRFKFIMDKKSKFFGDWFCTLPNIEELGELVFRSLNVLHIGVIAYLTVYYSRKSVHKVFTYLNVVFFLIRTIYLLFLWFVLIRKYIDDYIEWKAKNFRIIVKQNPSYKKKTGFQKSRSPTRASGAFKLKDKKSANPKKD